MQELKKYITSLFKKKPVIASGKFPDIVPKEIISLDLEVENSKI